MVHLRKGLWHKQLGFLVVTISAGTVRGEIWRICSADCFSAELVNLASGQNVFETVPPVDLAKEILLS